MSREAMKHTSGPWEVTDLRHSIVVRTESPNKTKYGASRYAAIGGFDRSDPDQLSEALANASLIAAAPDLLEALKDLLDEAEWLRREYSHDRERDGWDALEEDPCFTVARAAIAKATGEKS
jgi:hypothetical protein